MASLQMRKQHSNAFVGHAPSGILSVMLQHDTSPPAGPNMALIIAVFLFVGIMKVFSFLCVFLSIFDSVVGIFFNSVVSKSSPAVSVFFMSANQDSSGFSSEKALISNDVEQLEIPKKYKELFNVL